MNGAKILLAMGILVAFGVGTAAAADSLDAPSTEPAVPRYADTCAHGHNGFDCKPPNHTAKIDRARAAGL